MNKSPYQQQLVKNARSFKWFVWIAAAIFIMARAMYACHEMKSQPPPQPVEDQLKDTLVEGHEDADGTVPLLLERRRRP